MGDMNLRDAIKELLRYVGDQEYADNTLDERQKVAVDVLRRYTSGWVPKDPDFPHYQVRHG